MTQQWEKISPTERQEAMFERWLSPEGVSFDSPEAKTAYRARITRLKDAVQLKKTPDRVPVFSLSTFMPADLCRTLPREVMYSASKMADVWTRYLEEYEPDYFGTPGDVGCGQMLDRLDLKTYNWPGHGIPEAATCYQALEKEYMREEDYPALIRDPSDFWLRRYLPRVFGALAPFQQLPALTGIVELPGYTVHMADFGSPEVREALNALMDAGEMAYEWRAQLETFHRKAAAKGWPALALGVAKAPFDYLADTLRGTRHALLDLYRRPDDVLKAQEVLLPLIIEGGLAGPRATGNPIVFMPLHKGADGFMSDEQFKAFYWPFLKRVISGLVEEGCVPLCFAEGGYNTRLEYLNELPKGSCIWLFDRTDMKRAKEIVGETTCIAGNVSAGLLLTGTADEVAASCRELIDTAGKGGGFMLCPGTAMDQGKPDTIRAMISTTKKYGVYR